ncbi:MAG: class B sortase [Anaerotruncus sp.]|nr:class B sortase [Anaerotruncus sp.]
MKQKRLSNRILALALAAAMLLSATACSSRSASSEDDSSASSSTSKDGGIPAFINMLPEVDLSAIAAPEKPSATLLEKINGAIAQNSDVVGWLQIPDTQIDNEVLHYTDNDYYLRRDITKDYNWYGCYYADYENTFGDRNGMSQNTIIYGHSMDENPEGMKFGQLKKYLDIDFLQNHPYIYFSTPDDQMTWQIFSVMYTDNGFKYIHPSFPNRDTKMTITDVVNEMKDRSVFDINTEVNADDKILCLSTCTYVFGAYQSPQYEQSRFVICARLVRPGEQLNPTLTATVNADAKQPTFK